MILSAGSSVEETDRFSLSPVALAINNCRSNRNDMTFEVSRKISSDHPSLPGHFPGTPIVPGVLIVEEVMAALVEWQGNCRVIRIPAVKFLAPLKPGQAFNILLSAPGHARNQFEFSCRSGDRVLVHGRLETMNQGT